MKLISQIAIIFLIAVVVPSVLVLMVISGQADYSVYLSVVILVAFVTFAWIYSTTLKPLAELQKGIKKIKEGELDFSMESDTNSELGELVRSFEEMRIRLKESQEEKLRNEQETRELIRNIAHDLKTPITTVRGYSEGILDGVADSQEKQLKYIRTIHNKAVEMTSLIDELSFYAKVDTNRIPYDFKRIPVVEFFDDCADEIRLDLEGKNIAFGYKRNVSEEVRVIADPEQLKKVINNIVNNSVKYMNKENPRISMTLADSGDFVQCDLQDNGRGVDKKDLANLYDRFFRTDASRSSSTGGSGIGLSIAKKIIEDHGGRIWASCENGEGLCQHFILRKTEWKKEF